MDTVIQFGDYSLDGWWFQPIEGVNMDKVNQYLFYQFGGALRPLRELKDGDEYSEYGINCGLAKAWLDRFLLEFSHIPLTRSRSAARKFIEVLEPFAIPLTLEGLGKLGQGGPNLQGYQAANVKKALETFEAVFANEAQDLEVFPSLRNLPTQRRP